MWGFDFSGGAPHPRACFYRVLNLPSPEATWPVGGEVEATAQSSGVSGSTGTLLSPSWGTDFKGTSLIPSLPGEKREE